MFLKVVRVRLYISKQAPYVYIHEFASVYVNKTNAFNVQTRCATAFPKYFVCVCVSGELQLLASFSLDRCC